MQSSSLCVVFDQSVLSSTAEDKKKYPSALSGQLNFSQYGQLFFAQFYKRALLLETS